MIKIFQFLDKHEIDFRFESNFCCGFIFYFLDGSVYPRRYYDYALEDNKQEIVAESIEHVIEKACSNELVKDWRHRIEGSTIEDTFTQVEEYLISNHNYNGDH
mgnify:FL=1